ncbi:G patch domain-containing protein TGH isoform X2 [Magnolia sinica]|uniref:G patch domain-containing protein TGH isoform X2 n=1 Tax=Magnolia sinica TaxID=86752 RepID=UPI00265B21DF|nr:G patch domain-containing protein TGH isoform X2 [Magnolia sinica]
MDGDDEDFIFYGTPIEREEELTSRKRKAAADAAGNMRSLPPWKQEVTDEEGRRRFHGAFTGGFSAGYYNTVGSKEGWTPQTFTSSRKNRAEVKAQSLYNFLDDDEKVEMEGHLGTSLQFDTFGFTAAELARKQAEKEQHKRPSAIPGPVPEELVLPSANSIGVKLLLKMGWRHGHSIRDTRTNLLYDSRREARKAFLALSCDEERPQLAQSESVKSESETVTEWAAADGNDDVYASQSTPVFVLNPKQDLHGLGFDPFKHAPEFRESKRLRVSGNKELGHRKAASAKANLFTSNSGKFAPGFGIGALEELDVEDEDIYASGFEFEETYVEEDEEPSRLNRDKTNRDKKKQLGKKEAGVLSGFKVASNSEYQLERFNPPVIPPDFEPHHKFPAPLEIESKYSEPPPREVSPPEDNNLRLLIEGFATLVTRCGKLFEDLSREKNKSNPLFSFLTGGDGHDFYARKLWEEQQKHTDQRKQQLDVKSKPSMKKMTAETRGRILAERPLERSSKDSSSSVASTDVVHLQYNLSETFTNPASLVETLEAAKPFKNDPAKQERFEQFLKDKYQGGLRSTYTSGNSHMSENDRASERLDFEAAAETIEKGKRSMATDLPANQQFMELLAIGKGQFVSGGIEQNKVPQNEEKAKKRYPQREEYQWRPAPILCKRFDIIDPFMGKPPAPPRARSKMDSLIFIPDLVKTTKTEESAAAVGREPLPVSQSEEREFFEQETGKETEIEPNNASVQRPVDLYKAIFSDDSDDEEENTHINQADDAEKKTEGVSSTLNRMIAGDFLESLGKELGLEVPTDSLFSLDQGKTSAPRKESVSAADIKISAGNDRSIPTLKASDKLLEGKEATDGEQGASSSKTFEREIDKVVASVDGNGLNYDNPRSRSLSTPTWIKATDSGYLEHKVGKSRPEKTDSDDKRPEKMEPDDKRHRKHSRRRRSSSSSSLSDSNSSDESRYRDRSRSKEEKRRKGKKRSKHRSHKSKDSPARTSHHGSGRDYKEERREKRRSRDKERESGSLRSEAHRKHH